MELWGYYRKMNKKWLLRVSFATLLLAIFVLYPWYGINNPADRTVARLLSTEQVITMAQQHLTLWGVSLAFAIIVGITGGIIITRPYFRYIAPVIVNIVNIGQTVPSLAVLAIFMGIMGMGFRTAVVALFLYSILPIMRNTYAGINTISPNIIEAAKGMGMNPLRMLSRIELPLALPVIMAGIRTASVVNVGAATLATFIAAGGLGVMIKTGLAVMRPQLFLTGAVMAASLAVLLDYIFSIIENELTS